MSYNLDELKEFASNNKKVIDLANTSPDTNKSVSNPPDNATLSNLEGR